MSNRERVIKGLKHCAGDCARTCPYFDVDECHASLAFDVLALLREQDAMKQKMWNALYAEEDELEKKFVGSEDHDAWFTVYRPWLQRGFEIAIKVIAEQEGQ